MKRQLRGAAALLVVLAAGTLASACEATPPAASANGSTISRSTLNAQLQALDTTQAGACLLTLESSSLSSTGVEGAGGSGTFSMAAANAVLNLQVGNLLAEQYATSLGITVTAADLATAQTDFAATLTGGAAAAVQQSSATGAASPCQTASGGSLQGAKLLAGLPEAVRAAEVRNQAVDDRLLAHGADISAAAVKAYYQANLPLFTTACVSVIVTSSQGDADAAIARIDAGTPFATVAKDTSTDASASQGGAVGCDYTLSQVQQDLNTTSITVGTPLAPTEDSSSGQWVIYEVTSTTVEPFASAASVAKKELLQSSSNTSRVSRELVAFAHRSDVFVDPQYGSWKGLSVVSPPAPPTRFLLGDVGLGATAPGSTGRTSTGAGAG